MKLLSFLLIGSFLTVSVGCPAPSSSPLEGMATENGSVDAAAAEEVSLLELEEELLALVNQERLEAGLPELVREEGLDQVMRWYGTDMVLYHHIGHEDINGRLPTDRARYYSGEASVRCSEITAWWSGSSAEAHYEAYKNSPGHHAAYMEEGLFHLGPTTHVGIVVMEGTGPEGSSFEGRSGTYSGLLFCDQPITIEIDPFESPEE